MRKLIALESECRRCGKANVSYADPEADECAVDKYDGDTVTETRHVRMLCGDCIDELEAKDIVDMVRRT